MLCAVCLIRRGTSFAARRAAFLVRHKQLGIRPGGWDAVRDAYCQVAKMMS